MKSLEEDTESADLQRWERLNGWLDRNGADAAMVRAVRAAQAAGEPYPGAYERACDVLDRYLPGRGRPSSDPGRIGAVRAPGIPDHTEGPRIKP